MIHFFKRLPLIIRLGAGAMATMVLIPLTASPASLSTLQNLQANSAVQSERAKEDVSRVRRNIMAFWDAVDIYKQLVVDGVIQEHPISISDPESYEKYLDAAYVSLLKETSHESADEDTDEALDYDLLPEKQQRLVDGLVTHNRVCPENLKTFYLTGIYELCVKLRAEKDAAAVRDMRKRAAPMESDAPTMKDRLNVIKGIDKKAIWDAQQAH